MKNINKVGKIILVLIAIIIIIYVAIYILVKNGVIDPSYLQKAKYKKEDNENSSVAEQQLIEDGYNIINTITVKNNKDFFNVYLLSKQTPKQQVKIYNEIGYIGGDTKYYISNSINTRNIVYVNKNAEFSSTVIEGNKYYIICTTEDLIEVLDGKDYTGRLKYKKVKNVKKYKIYNDGSIINYYNENFAI